MHWGTFDKNVRAMVIVAELEAEAAQHEVVGIRHFGIAAAHRKARQYA